MNNKPVDPGAPNDGEAALDAAFEAMLRAAEDGRAAHDPAITAAMEAQPGLARIARSVACGPRARGLPSLDDFEVLDLLGEGGMGSVYLARQLSLAGRIVALKVLPHGVASSPGAPQLFRREAEAIAALRHPGIVGVHGVVAAGDLLGYTMDYIDGVSLLELIRVVRRRSDGVDAMDAVRETLPTLPPSETSYAHFIARLGADVASALEAVHRARLLHRDIKPSNLMLRSDGAPILMDFGLVRDEDATMVTSAGGFVGTALYAPPEQLVGDHRAVGAVSDIYALGATLHHALGLRPPFDGASPVAVLRQINQGGPAPLDGSVGDVPRDLASIVLKAMDPEPARRYPSAAALRDDLLRFLADRPVKARPLGAAGRTRRFIKRNRRAVTWATLSGLAVALLASIGVFRQVVAPRWADRSLARAHASLLHPYRVTPLFTLSFWGYRSTDLLHLEKRSLEEAIDAYDDAIRWDFGRRDMGPERTMVSAVQAFATGQSAPLKDRPPAAVIAYLDACRRYDWANGADARPLIDVAPMSLEELRLVGWAAFLVHDGPTAAAAWERLDALTEIDTLTSAGLGLLLLIDDRPALAYPRLQRAMNAHPNVGYLAQQTAEAALRCGDLAVARRCLKRAEALPLTDEWAQLRIEILLSLAAGESDALLRYHAAEGSILWTSVLASQIAEELLVQGRIDEALPILCAAANGQAIPAKPMRQLITAFESWWADLSEQRRLAFVLAALEARPTGPDQHWEEFVVGTVYGRAGGWLETLEPVDPALREQLVAIADRRAAPVDLRTEPNWTDLVGRRSDRERDDLARWLLTGEGDPPRAPE